MNTPAPIMINLLEVDQAKLKKRQVLLFIIALIVPMLGIMAGLYFINLNAYNQQIALNKRLIAEREQYSVLTSALEVNQVFRQKYEAKRNSIAKVEAMQITYTDVLEELSRSLPHRVVISHVRIEPDKISITGSAPGHDVVAHFLSSLRQSSLLGEVNMLSSETAPNSEETIFSIKIEQGVKR